MSEISFKNPDVTVTAADIADDVRLMRMSGREGLGQLFTLEIDLASEDGTINVLAALDSKVAVTLHYGDTVLRNFHGQVASLGYIGAIDMADGRHRHLYRAVLRPKAWLLTRRADCRIFQQKTANDIIKEVLDDAGLSAGTDYDLSKISTCDQREYCVQYRESDMNFIPADGRGRHLLLLQA